MRLFRQRHRHAGDCQGTATVALGGLNVNYTGAAHAATATTVPAGLAVTFTYKRERDRSHCRGRRTVVGTVNNANYAGNATGTLTIAPMLPLATTVAATTPRDRRDPDSTSNPQTSDTHVSFQYGTTIAYGSTTGSQDIGSGAASVSVSMPVTMAAQTVPVIYHYRTVATNSGERPLVWTRRSRPCPNRRSQLPRRFR